MLTRLIHKSLQFASCSASFKLNKSKLFNQFYSAMDQIYTYRSSNPQSIHSHQIQQPPPGQYPYAQHSSNEGKKNALSLLPDWKKAELHALAVSAGKPIHEEGEAQVCQCCNQVIHRQSINLGSNIKGLSFLGFGIPLFYLFLQYCIILNLLLIVTDGVVMLSRGYKNNVSLCDQYNANLKVAHGLGVNSAQADFLHLRDTAHQAETSGSGHGGDPLKTLCNSPILMVSNVQSKTVTSEIIAQVSSFIIHLFFLIYVKNSLLKTGEYYNQISVDLADYSVILKGLPEDLLEKKEVWAKLKNKLDEIDKRLDKIKFEQLSQQQTQHHRHRFKIHKQESLKALSILQEDENLQLAYLATKKIQEQIQQKGKHSQIGYYDLFHIIIRHLSIVNRKQMECYDVLVIPENERLQELMEEKEKVLEQYLVERAEDQKKDDEKNKKSHHLLEEYHEIDEKIKTEIKKDIVDLEQNKLSSETVIITFNQEEQRANFMEENILQQFKEELKHYIGNKADEVIIEQAPGPKEIIWHHLKHFHGKKLKILRGWALSLIFLFLIFIVFYFISHFKANLLKSEEHEESIDPNSAAAKSKMTSAAVIAWATFIGIIIFNKFVMGTVLHEFTHLQHHDDKADEDFSFAFKYALGMFFTTCLMTLIVEAFGHKNYYSHRFGVIEQQSLMFIFSAVLVPCIWLIHPYQLWHKFKRWRNYEKNLVSQHQANHLMADFEYSVGKRYAEIIQMMWFTFLYVDLIPAGTFLIFFGLCAYYWVDKYNLLRRSSVTHNISAKLSGKISYLIDFTLFWRSVGEIIFAYHLKKKVEIHSLILLAVSILYVILPVTDILNSIAGEQFKLNDKKIDDVWDTEFKDDNYVTMNPVYVQILKRQQEYRQEQERLKQMQKNKSYL